jgi:hypothetical protein
VASSDAEAVDPTNFWVNHEFTDGGIVYARLAEFMCLSGQVLPFRDIKAKG